MEIRRLNIKSHFMLLIFAVGMGASVWAQQNVSPDLYSGLRWRLIGPFRGGRSVAVSGAAGSSTTFYFGSVGGGIWKTTDAGMVWKPIFDGQPVASIGAIAVAPSDADVIYAGPGESDIRSDMSSGDGVYKSTDGGQTWSNVGLRDSRQISRIVIDSNDPNVVYAGVLGHAYGTNEERGVYKSMDGGVHWVKVLDAGQDIGISDLAIAIGRPKILFAGSWHTRRPPWSKYAPIDGPGGSLYRSQDGGATWSRLNGNGLPHGDWGRVGVAVSPDGVRIYALIAAKKGGLYRSDDGGANWRLENEDPRLISRAWYFNGITMDPQNPDVIYVPNVALYRSEDGGKTISVLRGAPGGDDYHQLWVDPKDSSRLLLGTDQGTSISLNRGETWSSWYNQPTAQFYHVTTDNAFPYMIYGAQQDSGSAGVPNRTDHGKITARDWITASGSESGYIAIDPKNPDILYDSGPFGQILRFNRRTSLSQDVSPWPAPSFSLEVAKHKYRDPWSPVLLFSPLNNTSLYLGTQYVMKTVDGGLHWEPISPDLTGASGQIAPRDSPTPEEAKRGGYGVVSTIAPSFLNKDLIWAGSDTGLIHLTQDGGKTWKDVTPPGIEIWSDVAFIEASHFDPAAAYAVIDRHQLDDQRPYIYRTHDYGATWQQINEAIDAHSFVRVVREDSQKRGLLFAGTEFGVYVSFDDGTHWQSFQLNLPVTSIRDIAIHDDDLVVATHGRAFWIMDDISTLRQIPEVTSTASAWLYSPATAIRVDNDKFPGTPLPPEEPAADNPPDGACIDFYVRNAPAHLTVEIFDDQQHLVRRFSLTEPHELERSPRAMAERWFVKPAKLENSPGMHRLVWNLAWGGPNGVSTDEIDDDGFVTARAPRVVPGNYQVRLTVDGKVFSQPLKVVMDPRSAATPQVLNQQLHVAQEIFAENLSTRKTLREIAVVQKQISDLKTQVTGKDANVEKYLTDAETSIAGILTKDGSQASTPLGLTDADADLDAALKVVESGERAVPSQALALFGESKYAAEIRIAQWNAVKQEILDSLNVRLRKAGLGAVLPGKPSTRR